DHLIPLLPWIHSVVAAEHVAADDRKLLAKLFLHLSLPLEGETRGRDNECPLYQPANLYFLQEKTGHNGLTGSGVVSEQETNAWHREEVVVNRFKMVWKWVNASDGERKIGIILVGQHESQGLDAEPESHRIAIE